MSKMPYYCSILHNSKLAKTMLNNEQNNQVYMYLYDNMSKF